MTTPHLDRLMEGAGQSGFDSIDALVDGLTMRQRFPKFAANALPVLVEGLKALATECGCGATCCEEDTIVARALLAQIEDMAKEAEHE